MSDGGDCRTAPATPGLLIINKEPGKMESRGEKSVFSKFMGKPNRCANITDKTLKYSIDDCDY